MLKKTGKFGAAMILSWLICLGICSAQAGSTREGLLSPIGADMQGIKFSYNQGRMILQDYSYMERLEKYYIPPMERYIDTLQLRVTHLLRVIDFKDNEIRILRVQNTNLRNTGDNIVRTSEVHTHLLEKKNRQLNFYKPVAIGSLTALLGVVLVFVVGK